VGKLGPIRNASTAVCQPTCTLSDSAVASLNIPFFDLTLHLGAANVLETARDAGIDTMWDGNGKREDLTNAKINPDMVPEHFGNELGIGQYAISVEDHANGMATMAAGGKRANAHFVKLVNQDGRPVYSEKLGIVKDLGLTPQQVGDLDATLVKVTAGHFSDSWQTAAKTGTWEWRSADPDKNAHVWTVGFTKVMATAVWVGTKSGNALRTKGGSYAVYGNNYAGPIFKQYMEDATKALFPHPDPSMLHFDAAGDTGNVNPPGSVPSPTPTATPTPPPTPGPTDTPTPTPPPTSTPPVQPPGHGKSSTPPIP
jgi:membrane peptidoglycan carboxypeptidase